MSTAQAAATGDEPSGPPIKTVAGAGDGGLTGESVPAASARLKGPWGIAVDSTGTVYFSEEGNHRVRKMTTDGRVSTIAGKGTAGFSGDDGLAKDAQLRRPLAVAVDGAGTVYIADTDNHRIRKVTTDGRITTIAGKNAAGFSGDGGFAKDAQLNAPLAVAVDSTGALYVADYGNHRVRKITPDGKISTFAGREVSGFAGDGGPARSARLNYPQGVAVDSTDNLFIADRENHRIRKVDTEGNISTVAGKDTAGFSGDGGLAKDAQLKQPVAVTVDSTGVLYIADRGNHRIRKVDTEGNISTVAGKDTAGFSGDDGPAASAQLSGSSGLAVDCVDTLYIADTANNRVRKVASAKMAGLPESGTVVSWANVRSKLRMGVLRESTKDGAEIHQLLATSRDHQRWRLVAAGQDNGDVLYRIENVRSGKVLEAGGPQDTAWAVIAQRAYEGAEARHQQWRLIPVGSATDTPRVYEIANHSSGLLLQVDTNARAAIRQDGSDGDHRGRQWQLLPV